MYIHVYMYVYEFYMFLSQKRNNNYQNELFELFVMCGVQKGYGLRLVFRKRCMIRESETSAKNVFRVPASTVYMLYTVVTQTVCTCIFDSPKLLKYKDKMEATIYSIFVFI